MNNNEGKITLLEMIEVARKYYANEISQEELAAFGDRFTIRAYMPIIEKQSFMMSLLTEHFYTSVESVMEVKTTELYRNIFFNVLLGGYAMIDGIERDLVTYENYDILYPLFYNFIIQYCEKDYKVFVEMLNQTLNFYNMKEISDILSSVDPDILSESMESNKNLIESLEDNKELIASLSEIAKIDNPAMKKFIDTIKVSAVHGARAQVGKELETMLKEAKKHTEQKLKEVKDKEDIAIKEQQDKVDRTREEKKETEEKKEKGEKEEKDEQAPAPKKRGRPKKTGN